MAFVWGFPALLVCMFFLFRLFLILAGKYKAPLLSTFEQYGGEDPVFFPLPGILIWGGGFFWSFGILLQNVTQFAFAMDVFGVLVLLIGLWVNWWGRDWFRKPAVRKFASLLPTLPLWYARLGAETSRYERRRIAYMWLRLPLRTRIMYNVNDHSFFLWAELVIMSTAF
jgi:hypothetical protein